MFVVPDPERRFTAVRLLQEMQRPRNGPDFSYRDEERAWVLKFPRLGALRMEYLIEIEDDGGASAGPDPSNPRRAPGPFGERSVVEWPGYEPPAWLEADAPPGVRHEGEVSSRILRARLPVVVWVPPGIDDGTPLPLLVAHDGIELDHFSSFGKFLEVAVHEGRIPPLRAALVGPVDRNNAYSASAAYARSFAHEILPFVSAHAPAPHGRNARVGMGASLGALAMLHIHRRDPATFGGLFLQSGSFFRQRFDPQEAGFPRFRRISRFVGDVLAARDWAFPIAVSMTCGTPEENLSNNRAMEAALVAQGYEVTFTEHPDAHNWVSWRDVFDPALTSLLATIWDRFR